MIVLPALPAAQVQCIRAADVEATKLKSWIVANGPEAAVQTWLDEAAKRGVGLVTEDRHVGGRRVVAVKLPADEPYRTIGALIYLGQANAVAINVKTDPPICEAEVSAAEESQPTQPRLDALSDQCGTPHEWLTNVGGKRVWVRPSPDAKYEAVDCMLQKLKASNLDLDLGFIGNEATSPKAKHK